MRALILRRVSLIQGGVGGPVLIGAHTLGDMARLQNFLGRNGHPYHVLDPDTDKDAADLVARYATSRADLPLVVVPDGRVLRNPTEAAIAYAIGMIGDEDHDKLYDVAVVGSGPAGLATAVYAASEGLSVAVFDARAFGGQAGASARIENYLGFPTGISGMALAGRAYNQAQKFGAQMLIPVSVTSLDCSRNDGALALSTDCGQLMRARSVVVASGARYRRPDIENLASFEGRGVWYWASPIEARLCAEQEVALVGGGNSAGQAAVFLSGHARKVYMVIRGGGLGASMSRYLIERIEATPNIELLFNTEIVGLDSSEEGTLAAGALEAAASAASRPPSISATCSCSSAPIPPPTGSTAAASWSIAAALSSPAHNAARVTTGRLRRWRRRCRACSRSAMSGRARSSVSAERSERARRWWRRCMVFWKKPQNRRCE